MVGHRRVTIAIVLAGVSLAAAGIWLKWRADRLFWTPSILLSRFPAEDAAVFSVNFAALRSAGLLTAGKSPVESEYRQFLEGTGFDYRRDLDFAVVSMSRSGNYFIARGRFDWKKLADYARRQGGSCYQDLCQMPGSTPERHISFLPLRSDAIALGVSKEHLAAMRLVNTGEPVKAQLPDSPVWLSLPGAVLKQQNVISPGMRLMLSALTNADRIVVTFGPQPEAHLEAACRTEDDARVLASQLKTTTAIVKEGMSKGTVARDDSLARVLSSGNFDQNGSHVTGRWPVARDLIQSLTAGI